MTTSPSPIRFSAPRHTTAEISAKKAKVIPNFKKQEEKQFYREVVQSYRAAARNILRRAWSDDKAEDIGEYAVMLAVVVVIVVGTSRMVGSHANTVFSQVASSIQ